MSGAQSQLIFISDTLDANQHREEQVWGIRQNKQTERLLLRCWKETFTFKCLKRSSAYSNQTCSLCGGKEAVSFL